MGMLFGGWARGDDWIKKDSDGNMYKVEEIPSSEITDNLHIELNQIYGLDGQYINFIPDCKGEIANGDVIYSLSCEIMLVCVAKNKYMIVTDKPHQTFIRGIDLLRKFKKY